MKWNWKVVRDPAFFLLGAGTFIHEVTIQSSERPTILAASLALMGVPVFLRKDEAAAQAAKEAPVAPVASRAELADQVGLEDKEEM
jgi:hypothetical protein